MKKVLSILALSIFIFLLHSNNSIAAPAACPSTVMDCTAFYDGCTDPCMVVVIRVGGRGVPGDCQCQLPSNTCAGAGESCQGIQCCTNVPYCWGHPGDSPPITCHTGPQVPPTPTPVPTASGGTGISKCDTTGIQTAIGCIHVLTSPEVFLGEILKWAIGIGGGIAFLLMLYAGFMIMTAAGNPERLKAGQELLTSAISGLILIIFSVFILKFIGVDILGLDAFGFGP